MNGEPGQERALESGLGAAQMICRCETPPLRMGLFEGSPDPLGGIREALLVPVWIPALPGSRLGSNAVLSITF